MVGSRGGKSRFRGVAVQLQGGLEDLLAEVGKEVADRLLALADNLSGGGGVDGVGDVAAELLEALAQLGDEGVGAERG